MPLDVTRQLVTRWTSPDPAHIPVLKKAGIEAVILEKPDAAFQEAARQAGIDTGAAEALKDANTAGLWPGVRTPNKPKDWVEETASASNEPWVDANGWLVAYERANHPGRVPVLAYEPNEKAGLSADRYVALETLEIGLIEARVAGGNFVLALEPRYREGLLKGDTKAVAAWESLGKTARWLNEHRPMMGLPAKPTITMVADNHDASAEIAMLAYRRGANPAIVAADRVPAPQPGRILAVMAPSLEKQPPELQKKLWAHAEAGAFVAIDWKPNATWKEIKKQEDRTFYQVGKGQVVVYKETIVDPSEFALDVMDLVGYKNRPSRLWNALAAIPLATEGPRPGEAVLQVVNYGQPTRDEVQARVLGHYGKATFLSPGRSAETLRTYKRGLMTEVYMPRVERVGLVHFTRA